MPFSELWAGNIYGTNTGRVFLQLTTSGETLCGKLNLSDDRWGLSTLNVVGQINGDRVTFEGDPLDLPEGVELGKIYAEAIQRSNGILSGEWKSEIGTAGTFELHPHVGTRLPEKRVGPEQLYTASRDLGILRLSRADLSELIATVQRKFPQSKVIVTHIERGAELARYSEDFESNLSRITELRFIKINAQAAAASNLQKVITIDLGPNYNRIITQGPDEAWVLGEAESTASFLRLKEKRLSTAVGKYRVNVNQVIALVALAFLPELNLRSRIVFLFSVVIVLFTASRFQSTAIPNLIINVDDESHSWIKQAWPTTLSWLVSVTAAVAASIIYGILTRS